MYQNSSNLFNHKFTRAFMFLLAKPVFSKIGGFLLSSKCSKIFIKSFVKNFHIDLTDYEEKEYQSFNDFFIRKVRLETRPIDSDPKAMISPCDGLLSAYHITNDLHVEIKGTDYTISELLNRNPLDIYQDGILLVLRLKPDNYHRYHFLDDGILKEDYHVKGKLHTVQPIIHQYAKVFHENDRHISFLETKNFGLITQVEVGAMFVGKIFNHKVKEYARGQEKGYFLFGGSTIVLLLDSKKVSVNENYFLETKNGVEVPIRFGERIGYQELC